MNGNKDAINFPHACSDAIALMFNFHFSILLSIAYVPEQEKPRLGRGFSQFATQRFCVRCPGLRFN
jgi:hypothetical protein